MRLRFMVMAFGIALASLTVGCGKKGANSGVGTVEVAGSTTGEPIRTDRGGGRADVGGTKGGEPDDEADDFRPPEGYAKLKIFGGTVVRVERHTRDLEAHEKSPRTRIRFQADSPKAADMPAVAEIIAAANRPVIVELNFKQNRTDQLAAWGAVKHIVGLDIRGQAVDNDSLKGIAALDKLEFLKVESNVITDEGVKHLAGMTNLRRLLVLGFEVKPKAYAHIAAMTKLESMQLGYNFPVTDETLPYLKTLVNLRELKTEFKKVTDAGMANIRGLKELRKLHLQSPDLTPAGLTNIAGLENLEELQVEFCAAFPSGWANLTLDSGDKVKIRCRIGEREMTPVKAEVKKLKPGDAVKLAGRYSLGFTPGEVEFDQCLYFPPK